MKRNTSFVTGLTAALLGSTMVVACGGRTIENEWTGGVGGFGGTGGSAASGGAGGTDGSTGGSGGLTGGAGGSPGDTGGTGGSTGGTGGTGGSTGGTGGSTGGTGGVTGGAGGATGGRAGSGGATGGKAGAPSVDAGVRITCGTAVCGTITSVAGTWSPCCPVGETNACGGLVLGAVCITATRGVADSTCPTLSIMGQMLPGCCRPSGLCGANMSVVGLGCADPSMLGGATPGKCKFP